jgi:diketogulonate reductase-like aldo/keto reductase
MEKQLTDSIELNNGTKMSRFGLGTHAVANCSEIVYQSIKDGVRLIDTASVYNNEKEVGEGIAKAIFEGIVKREDLYVITKLWVYDKHRAEEAIKESLERLGLEYVDLYLDHFPAHIYKDKSGTIHKVAMHVLWINMEDFVRKGYTRSIGVCNYNVQSLINLLSLCEIKPVVNQVELHPYFPQENLLKYCRTNNIQIMAYNSLCKGTYAKKFHSDVNLLEEELLKQMAIKYNTTPGNIALNWALLQDLVVIPATSNPHRMGENIKSLQFRLSEEDLKTITNTLDKNMRLNNTENFDYSMRFDLFA